jgi:hypothetical protein
LLSLNETYELLEWDSLSDSLSLPIGIALNGLYILMRLDQNGQTTSYHEKDVFEGSHSLGLGVLNEKTGGIS